jgi:hypothetical protein
MHPPLTAERGRSNTNATCRWVITGDDLADKPVAAGQQ